jgi:D-3-phosphoglycerate dehydrogenase
MIGAEEFKRMKSGAYLINTARGGLIDENALLTAVESGTLAGAALDALMHEPPENRSLIDHPNILVTPHIAGWGVDAGRNMCIGAAEQVVQVLAGSTPTHAVNEPLQPRNRRTG